MCKNGRIWRWVDHTVGHSTLNRSPSNKTNLISLKQDEHLITDKAEIANKCNSFFTNVRPELANNIITHNDYTHKHYLSENNNHNIFKFKPMNADDIDNLFDRFQNKNSCGYDGLSMKHIKQIKSELIKPITLIITQSLSTGHFPDELKIASHSLI